jgi:hypothetical protein
MAPTRAVTPPRKNPPDGAVVGASGETGRPDGGRRSEPAASFYARLSAEYGSDIDLEAVIREARRSNTAPSF